LAQSHSKKQRNQKHLEGREVKKRRKKKRKEKKRVLVALILFTTHSNHDNNKLLTLCNQIKTGPGRKIIGEIAFFFSSKSNQIVDF
jgi:hypothetical protein